MKKLLLSLGCMLGMLTGYAETVTVWSENWDNCEAGKKPSEINPTMYSQTNDNTKLYDENLAGGAKAPELLLSKKANSTINNWTITITELNGWAGEELTLSYATNKANNIAATVNGKAVTNNKVTVDQANQLVVVIQNTATANLRIDDIVLSYEVAETEPIGIVLVDVGGSEVPFNKPVDVTFETGTADVVEYIVVTADNHDDFEEAYEAMFEEGEDALLALATEGKRGTKITLDKSCQLFYWSKGFVEDMLFGNYTFQYLAPEISPVAAEVAEFPTVSIAADTYDPAKFEYTIKYTTDGSDPRESATAVEYTAPFVPAGGKSVTVKAAIIANPLYWIDSDVVEVTYTIRDMSSAFKFADYNTKFYPGDQVMFLGYGYNKNGQTLSFLGSNLSNGVAKAWLIESTKTVAGTKELEIPEYYFAEVGMQVLTLEKNGEKWALKKGEDQYMRSVTTKDTKNQMEYAAYAKGYSDATITINPNETTTDLAKNEVSVVFDDGADNSDKKCTYFCYNYNAAMNSSGTYTNGDRFSIYTGNQGSSRTFMYVKHITKTIYWDNANGATFTGDPYVFFSLDGGVTFEEEAVKMEEHVAPAAAPARAEGESTPAVITHEAAIPSSATHLYFAESNDGEHFTNATNQFEATHGLIYDGQGTTGIENVTVVESNEAAPVEYYNLQGVRVDNPVKGIYIMRQGNKAVKVVK